VVVRASGAVDFPARFALIAASNPCPCGFDGDSRRRCRCLAPRLDAYRSRLSGPLLDRIDIRLRIPRLSKSELFDAEPAEASADIRERVEVARERQRRRLGSSRLRCNAEMPGAAARQAARLTDRAEGILARAVERYALSGRAFDRVLKVARTVADLEGVERVAEEHVLEALRFRAEPARPEDAGVA
jgi:magnesium chelatase family protein